MAIAQDTGGSGRSEARTPVYQRIDAGSWGSPIYYRAPSAGFVLCTINNPSAHGKGCVCWGYVDEAQVTGGNIGYFGPDWEKFMADNPHTCIYPQGDYDQFRIGVMQNGGAGQQTNAPFDFWWVSLTGARITGPDTSAGSDLPPPPLPQEAVAIQDDRLAFIAILEQLLGKPIDAETQQQLLALGSAP